MMQVPGAEHAGDDGKQQIKFFGLQTIQPNKTWFITVIRNL